MHQVFTYVLKDIEAILFPCEKSFKDVCEAGCRILYMYVQR